MALSDAEIESLRFHLGYGNIGLGASTYSPDGFLELFRDVIAVYLTGTTETSATTAIAAGATVEVAPVSMTDIVPNARLVVDVGDAAEIVTVKSVTGATFTATFTLAHPASGYPVALLGGKARLRMLLNQADAAWSKMTSASIGNTAGLKQLGQGEIEWFQGFQVLKDRLGHYKAIVMSISSLVRVLPRWADEQGASTTIEAY